MQQNDFNVSNNIHVQKSINKARVCFSMKNQVLKIFFSIILLLQMYIIRNPSSKELKYKPIVLLSFFCK